MQTAKKTLPSISQKWLLWFLIFSPILDVITAIMTRFGVGGGISIGVVVRGGILAYCACYLLFSKRVPFRKNNLAALGVIFLFFIVYIVHKILIRGLTILPYETIQFCKYWFLPIVIIYMINTVNIFHNKDEIVRYACFSICLYALYIILPIFLGVAFNSYTYGNAGKIGWFYSANEIGIMLNIMLVFIYIGINEHKNKVLSILAFIFGLTSLSLLGTKVALFSSIMTILLCTFITLKRNSFSMKALSSKLALFSLIFAVFINVCNSGIVLNIIARIAPEDSNIPLDAGNNVVEKYDDTLIGKILNGRQYLFADSYNKYGESPTPEKLLGTGFIKSDGEVIKLTEMDLCDLFFGYGMVGAVLYVALIILISIDLLQRYKLRSDYGFYAAWGIVITFGISLVSGHVLGSPTIGFFIAILYGLIPYCMHENRKKDKRKISILGLHLGYGGVESAIISQANMLCDEYQVSLVVLYKLGDDRSALVDDRVKVVYLTKHTPNREKFISCIKGRHFFKGFWEGIKGCHILLAKYRVLTEYISYCQDEVIISSNINITRSLSKQASDRVITIAEEHGYHLDNPRYLKKIKKYSQNIDMFVAVSKEITRFYSDKLNIQCYYIPNSIEGCPKTRSSLNSKRLISVGRLSPEKGFLDLVDVFHLVHNRDSSIKLDIIGDGQQRSEIEQRIANYNLGSSAILYGFCDHKSLYNMLLKSSLYVSCSLEESFGITVLEAASCGVPTIAFDSAKGIAEIITNQSDGILIRDRDKKAMADKIIKLFNNHDLLYNMGEQAKKIVNKYSYKEVRQQWISLLSNNTK